MHLLKSNSIIKLSFSFSFAIKFTFTNLSSLRTENWLSFKIIILLVYILIIPNKIPIVILLRGKLHQEMEASFTGKAPSLVNPGQAKTAPRPQP